MRGIEFHNAKILPPGFVGDLKAFQAENFSGDEPSSIRKRFMVWVKPPMVIDMALNINEETVNDRAKLLMHRVAARQLSVNPHLIDAAKSKIMGGVNPPDYVAEWREVLDLDVKEVRRALTRRSEKMDRLRLSSPFGLVINFGDPVLRKRIWRLARKGLAKVETPAHNHGLALLDV
jgi:hypothetical protein